MSGSQVSTNAEEQVKRYQRRFRQQRYPYAVAENHGGALILALSVAAFALRGRFKSVHGGEGRVVVAFQKGDSPCLEARPLWTAESRAFVGELSAPGGR